MPTSTINVRNACHPFSTGDIYETEYILIHNGMISNDVELANAHDKLGIEYHSNQPDGTFNDSEALLWDVAEYLEGKQDALKAYGMIAFICMAIPKDGRKHTKLYFGRNSQSPLHMQLDDTMIFLSSEGEGESIDTNTLYTYDYRTHVLKTSELTINSYNPDTVGKYYSVTQDKWLPYASGGYGGGYDDEWDDGTGQWYHVKDVDDQFHYDSHEAENIVTELPDYVLLNPKADYGWHRVMRSDDDSIIYTMKDGGMKRNIIAMIGDRVTDYMQAADGNYFQAYLMVKADLQTYIESLDADRLNDIPDDEDVILEMDILVAVIECLFTAPGWVTNNSVSTAFQLDEDENEQYQRWLAQQAFEYKLEQDQNTLQLGA